MGRTTLSDDWRLHSHAGDGRRGLHPYGRYDHHRWDVRRRHLHANDDHGDLARPRAREHSRGRPPETSPGAGSSHEAWRARPWAAIIRWIDANVPVAAQAGQHERPAAMTA